MANATSVSVHSLNDPTTSPAIIAKALQHLREPAYFTTALAVYRRLQYGRFFDSSYLFTNLDLASDSSKLADHIQGPWFYAFVDRGCRPETQVWLCGSWEVEGQDPLSLTHDESSNGVASKDQTSPINTRTSTPSNDAGIRALLLSLIHSIKSLPTPPSIHPPSSVLAAQTQILTSHPSPPNTPPKLADPSITLWGAIHSTTTAHLNALNVLATHLLPVVPNHTFVFPLSKLPPPPPLPENLRWGKVEKEHYPLVRSRTEIARQDLTLASLHNLAIFPLSPAAAVAPIAWAFIGLDGSLTSLHVEESHRRLGLAKALTTKIFAEGMGVFWGKEERGFGMREKLAHGNVAVGNEKSAGMCRSLGGVDVGEVFWVKVDLGDVEEC